MTTDRTLPDLRPPDPNRRALLARLGIAASGLLAGTLGGPAALAAPKATRKEYDYFVTGTPWAAAPPPRAVQTAALMGGRTDIDAAFQRLIAQSGGGNFVVIRASGADDYNPYVLGMTGDDGTTRMAAVQTIVTHSREAAADPFVLDCIRRAGALFIAGGDQGDYIRLWKGTPLAAELAAQLAARRLPIGGISAGLAVMGQFDYSALLSQGVTSAQALANPYHRYLTLDQGFLTVPGLEGVVTDTHFFERDRMGRLLTFTARIIQDGWAAVDGVRGIGVDSDTALLLTGHVVERVGAGPVWFVRPSVRPGVCAAKVPLTYNTVGIQRLGADGRFDLASWSSPDGATLAYTIDINGGLMSSSTGSVY